MTRLTRLADCMDLINVLKRAFGAAAGRDGGNNGAAGGDKPRRRGAVVLEGLSEVSPLCVAAVYRCVRLLSDSVAQLPIRLIRKDRSGVDREVTTGRLGWLLSVEPNKAMSAFDMWSMAVQQVLLYGNAYIYPRVDWGAGDFTELVLCNPGTVQHDVLKNVYTVNDVRNGVQGVVEASDMIHLKGLSTDQRTGQSVLSYARRAVDTAGAGDVETRRRFQSGGSQRVLLRGASAAFAEQSDDYIGDLAEDFEAQLKTGRLVVGAPGDISATMLSMSSSDMQFLETRKFTVIDICRFFGVHPSFVFEDTSNNYKSAENANAAFLSNTLNPLLVRIENELRRKLCGRDPARRIEFDRRAMWASDLAGRADYVAKTIGAGLMTVNEWRRAEGLPPVKGGNQPLVSANLRPISEVAAAPPPANKPIKKNDAANVSFDIEE